MSIIRSSYRPVDLADFSYSYGRSYRTMISFAWNFFEPADESSRPVEAKPHPTKGTTATNPGRKKTSEEKSPEF